MYRGYEGRDKCMILMLMWDFNVEWMNVELPHVKGDIKVEFPLNFY